MAGMGIMVGYVHSYTHPQLKKSEIPCQNRDGFEQSMEWIYLSSLLA